MNPLVNPLGAIAVLLIAFFCGFGVRGSLDARTFERLHADYARAFAQALDDARAIEHQLTATMTDIGDRHAQQHTAAPGLEADIMSALRTGTVRLRREWQRCETRRVSDLAATTAERDAASAERDALAAAIVRVGYETDQQLTACQAVIRAYRAQ